MTCMTLNEFAKFIQQFDEGVIIDQQKDKPLRYNVWETTVSHVKNMINSLSTDALPNKNQSAHVLRKLNGSLKRIGESDHSASGFIKNVIDTRHNIEMSIALHEVMESVKGEADKARNNGIKPSKISNDGVLPALPMSRIAASIGRKVAFQKGYRFSRAGNTDATAQSIEELYFMLGKLALSRLQDAGYVDLHTGIATIKDYIDKKDLKKDFPTTGGTTKDVESLSLNSEALQINTKATKNYFLDRTDSDISDTELGTVTEILRSVRQITQPSTIVLPDTSAKQTEADFRTQDAPGMKPDSITEDARQRIYDKPVFVHESLHELMELLNQESAKTGKSASQIVRGKFKLHPHIVNSLFGLKRSDDFSVDKKESVSGQNLSKTTPLDDLVEYYDVLQEGFDGPAPLHMSMKIGRNARLYYNNSVLNPHASKQSRYMLTAGEQVVEHGSDDFKYLVFSVKEALGDKSLNYTDFTGDTDSKLDTGLKFYGEYESAPTLQGKLAALSSLSLQFPGVDYVSLLTTMKAVKDIRSPSGGKVTTQFQSSSDATASGGTLTFLQALGTNPSVTNFLEDIGFLKQPDGTVDIKLNDLYQVMSDSISKFVAGKPIEGLIGQDRSLEVTGNRKLMQDTLDLLFSEGQDVRELSKGPTMTFVYGQGEKGATQTMARSLADRLIDSLDSKDSRRFMAQLLNDGAYNDVNSAVLKDTKGLYDKIVSGLIESGLPGQLFQLIDASINERYLKEYKGRSERIFELVKKLPNDQVFKILPAGAVLAQEGELTLAQLKQEGMPIAKVFEVSAPMGETGSHVLTRKDKTQKTVMDVSTIHGTDAALLYHGIEDANPTQGVVVVHDDIRGSVKDVRAVEDSYRGKAVDIANQYDIHEQILKALALYDPSIAKSSEYKTIMDEVTFGVQNKQQIIEQQFNENTSALIGDGDKFQEFAETKTRTGKKPGPKPRTSQEQRAEAMLAMFADDSPLIRKFLKGAERVTTGKKNEYIPEDDTVTISGTDQGRDEGTVRRLDLRKTADRKLQQELIEHEIVHSYTAGYINKAQDPQAKNPDREAVRDIKYIETAVAQMTHLWEQGKVGEDIYDRVVYIKDQPTPQAQVAEMVSILSTEPDNAAKIYELLANKTASQKLRDTIDRLVKKIASAFQKLTDADMEKEVDVEKLYGAIERTVDKGIAFKTQQRNEANDYQNRFSSPFGAGPDVDLHTRRPDVKTNSIRYLNYAVSSMLNSKLERNGKRLLGNLDTIMRRKFPIYTDVASKMTGVYDSSPALQQMVHTITGNDIDKLKKADVLSQFAKVSGERNEVINQQLSEFHRLLRPFSEAEVAKMGQYVMDTPLHDYFILAGDLTTGTQITEEIARLEKSIDHSAKLQVNRLVASNVTGDMEAIQNAKIYNLETRFSMDGKFGLELRKLMVLKSIEAVGLKDFEKLLENTDLVNLIKDQTVANRMSVMENKGSSKVRDSLVADYYKERNQMKAIEKGELRYYEDGEDTGWKVLQKPTDKQLGIVYRPVIDSTEIAGAFTDTKLTSSDIDVGDRLASYRGVVETADGKHKLVLTKDQKLKLGLIPDFSQALVRTTAHNMAIQESQIIRDELLKKETRMEVTADNHKELLDIVKADNIDSPWFLKLEGTEFADLPAEVRAKYMTVKGRASDVKGFNEEVDLVRKDISHWLLGGSATSLFTNPKMKWMMRIVKDLISGAKIGMVVLNPMKIAQDNVSNLSYLSMMGVSPLFAAQNYKDIVHDFTEYQKLNHEIIAFKVRLVANPNDKALKSRLEKLQEQVKKNPVGDLGDKGFINSLGSDIVSKNSDTLSGLQADMHTSLEYLLLDKKGNMNHLGAFVNRLHKAGFKGEGFLQYLGGIAGKFKAGKGLEQELDKVADRLSNIRSEDDVINYVSQYINSPGNEAVRLGSAATDLTDVMAKETLYRHLVQEDNMSPEAARLKVLDSFPDYKENMPLAIKQLSDSGILMFPSFWLRIQKAIYRLGRDRPVNLATELMVEEALGSNVSTIIDQNLLNKSNTWGGLIHSPHETPGVGSVAPMHIW